MKIIFEIILTVIVLYLLPSLIRSLGKKGTLIVSLYSLPFLYAWTGFDFTSITELVDVKMTDFFTNAFNLRKEDVDYIKKDQALTHTLLWIWNFIDFIIDSAFIFTIIGKIYEMDIKFLLNILLILGIIFAGIRYWIESYISSFF